MLEGLKDSFLAEKLSKINEKEVVSREEVRRIFSNEEIKDRLEESYANQDVLLGKVVGIVNGGYLVKLARKMAFMPNSLSEIPMGKGSSYMNKNVEVVIKELYGEEEIEKLVVSRRDITIKREEGFFNKVKLGERYKLKIVELLDYGIAVEAEGVKGFVHISELSWGKIEKINEKYRVGEVLDGVVILVDKDKRSLKFSVKKLLKDPWIDIDEKYSVGDKVVGIVRKITTFGIMVELEEGIVALLHKRNIDSKKLESYKSIGDRVVAEILDMDIKAKKLGIGVKQLRESQFELATEKYTVNDIARGKVITLKPFGIFVELFDGVDVFIHKSDWKDGDSETSYKQGDDVEFKILSINFEEKKIRAGIKQLIKTPWEMFLSEYTTGDKIVREISSVTDFGFFVEISEEIDGMVHRSVVSDDPNISLREHFDEGKKVELEIDVVDDIKKRVRCKLTRTINI